MLTVIGFYVLPILMVLSPLMILFPFSDQRVKLQFRYGVFVVVWGIYLSILLSVGILDNLELPPKLPLLVILPMILWIIWTTGQPIFRGVIQNTPRHYPVYIQSFRILVELLIYGGFLNQVIPQRATFEGLNFDILVGITALPMAWLIQKNILKKQGVLIWNIISLMVLSLTAYSFISSFFIYREILPVYSTQFARLPYVLLAGSLLPFAIFYHVISIRQQLLKQEE